MNSGGKHLHFHEDRGEELEQFTFLAAILTASHIHMNCRELAQLVHTWLDTFCPDKSPTPAGITRPTISDWPTIAGALETLFPNCQMPTRLTVYAPHSFQLTKHRFMDNPRQEFCCWEQKGDISIMQYCDDGYTALLAGPILPRGNWWAVPNPRMALQGQQYCWLCTEPRRLIQTSVQVGSREATRFLESKIPWRDPCGDFRVFACKQCAIHELLRITADNMRRSPTETLMDDILESLSTTTTNHRDNIRWYSSRASGAPRRHQ